MKKAADGNGGHEQVAEQSLSQEHKRLVDLLREGPRLPRQRLIYAYASMCVTMLQNDAFILTSTERDVRDLLKYAEAGSLNLNRDRERILRAARAALTGNAQAFERMSEYVNRWPVQRALKAARGKERVAA